MNNIEQIINKNKGINNQGLPGYQHHDGLWFGEEEHNSYYNLAQIINKTFPQDNLNILDIGSGAGSLSHWLRTLNKTYNVVTLDGNIDILNSPYILNNYHFVIRTDEEYELINDNQTIKFNLILCYEHLEHIQEHKLEKWFKNLNKHSNLETIFLGTSSTNPYNDDVHVTVRPKKWWINIFKKYGWINITDSFLNETTKPFNFVLEDTSELNFIKLDINEI